MVKIKYRNNFGKSELEKIILYCVKKNIFFSIISVLYPCIEIANFFINFMNYVRLPLACISILSFSVLMWKFFRMKYIRDSIFPISDSICIDEKTNEYSMRIFLFNSSKLSKNWELNYGVLEYELIPGGENISHNILPQNKIMDKDGNMGIYLNKIPLSKIERSVISNQHKFKYFKISKITLMTNHGKFFGTEDFIGIQSGFCMKYTNEELSNQPV